MANPQFTTEELESEQWRTIIGFESTYAVSNLGRIKRLSFGDKRAHTYPGRILKPTIFNGHYFFVSLFDGPKAAKRSVHSLVAAAFIGQKPKGMQVNHRDGNKLNNRTDNLEYVTPKGNTHHAIRTGLFPTGDRHWAKRHPEWVDGIRGKNHWVHKRPERKERLFGGKQPDVATRRGSRNGVAKLNEVDVRAIRSDYDPPTVTQQILADRYGVTITTINAIIKRRNWAWLK